MHRIAKSVLVALFAVMCMGALAATSASAVEPLFLNESGKALLFTGDGIGGATLEGAQAGQKATVTCDKNRAHGLILDKSSLAREVNIEFEGKCEETLNGSKSLCSGEPLKPVLSFGELGLLNGHVYLLIAPESGTTFIKFKCGTEIKTGGAVIGEFPLTGTGGGSQYGVSLKDFLLLFKASGVKQEPEEIELLGKLMTGVSLKVEGFLGEKASEKASSLILVDGNGTIDP